MKNKFKVSALVAALSFPLVGYAGGLHFYELSTTDLGFAAAGQAARAEDASTVYGNPAGMTRLAGNQLSMGALGLYADAGYKQDGKGALPINNPGNVGGFHPHGSFFYSHSLSSDFKLGLGMYGNYGLALDFGKWAGSRYVEEVYSKAISIQPTAAYRLNDQWSVGAGLIMSYGFAGIKRTDTGTKYEVDDQDWSQGVRLGVMYEPTPYTRVGFVWQSQIDHDFDMGAFSGGPAGTYAAVLSKSVRPEERMLSIWHRLNSTWAVMGNIGWQRWSKFTNYGLEHRTYNGPLEFDNTWHAALGAQYTVNANTKWNFGVSHDTSLYKNQKDTTLLMPNGKVWRFATGVQYKLTKEAELGAAVEYLRAESCSDQHPAVSGVYDQPNLYFASVQFLHKF